MLRKKLFGTEIPVETHARLQSQIRLLESKIHDLQLEESSRFLDQKNYDENSRRMKEVQKQYQQLLKKSEVILSVLDVNADNMVKELKYKQIWNYRNYTARCGRRWTLTR